jgi:hypothetical protein
VAGFIATLRSGDWLTRERLRLLPVAVLIMSVFAIIYVVTTSDGLNDYQGRPLGSDFSNVYAAGSLVREGRPEAAFDWAQHHAREQAIFGERTPFYGWHYPPFFLFIAAALATMPYPLALLVWQIATLALYLVVTRAIVVSLPSPLVGKVKESDWLLPALAFPAVVVNLGHGQNGFLSAALIGAGLVLLDRKPIAAGLMFGLMAYKPQFGFMIPLALIAGGYWRAFAAAAFTVAALAIVTTAAFGTAMWIAFLDSLHLSRTIVLEQGNTGWYKIQSVFSWVRAWGGSIALAYAAHGAIALAVGVALVRLWRSEAAYPLKAAALALATVIATPYSLDYDLMVLGPALAFLAAHGLQRGFGRWEISALALLWLMPLVARSSAEFLLIPLGCWSMLLIFALILRRADAAGRAFPAKPRLTTGETA